MSTINLEEAPGIILRRFDAQRSDLILRILTRDSGKIVVVARGARGSKKSLFAWIDIFDCGKFTYSSPKRPGDLAVLKGISERNVWANLRDDLTTFSIASLTLEVTDVFAREGDPEAGDLFNPLFLCLQNLNQVNSDNKRFVCLIFYLIQLLRISGFDLLSDQCEEDSVETRWFGEMITRKVAFVPDSRELITDGLLKLIRAIQGIDGYELKTVEGVLQRLQNFASDQEENRKIENT